MKILSLMPWADWLALAVFLSVWVAYAMLSRRWGALRPSLLAATNRYRYLWMLQTTVREPRMVDAVVLQNLTHTPSFFSSTTLFIIGGMFALLGTTDKAAELVRDFPFAQATPMLVFEFKILVLLAIFIYAFFRFSWSMRQYTFVALMLGAMPPASTFLAGDNDRESSARHCAAMLGTAAETFNDGLRAYYFSFAALSWFFSPVAFMLGTLAVVLVLYGREYHSDVSAVLNS